MFNSSALAFTSVTDNEANIMTSIASGRLVEKKKAAAVVSVILREDIEKIGALSIEELLETVPGLHVAKDSYLRSNKYIFRGIGTTFNQEVLFLINNIPIKSNATGNRTNAGFGGMPVDNVERVEVIRGPNSALYGADAYSGIINIVLKNNETINDVVTIKARTGELDSNSVFIEYSKKVSDGFGFYISANHEKTDGNNSVIEHDAQTDFDNLFNTNASLAPSSPNFKKEISDYYISVKLKDFDIRHMSQTRNDMGVGFSANDVLAKDGHFDNRRSTTEISYNKKITDAEFSLKASYFMMDEASDSFVKIYPDGAFFGTFPDGLISTPERKEENINFDFKTIYSGFSNNFIQIGAGYSKSKVFDIKDYRNFDIATMTPFPNGVIDVSSDPSQSFLTERKRDLFYVFIQDEYYFKKDWILTTGLRYDNYSDFGETINPRMAVVWNTNRKLTSKFLYGKAFRAPSFSELHAKSNPIALGNSNLSAAKIDTYELSFNYDLNFKSEINWNLFYYESTDQIEPSPQSTGESIFENIGETIGYGAELEFNHEFDDNVSFYTNYSYQQSENKRTNKKTIINPAHLFYSRLSFDYQKWNFNIQGNWVGTRSRAKNDSRKDLRGYHKVDFNITRKNLLDIYGFNAKIYVKNLTDEDIREPSVIGGMRNDYPMSGRNAHIELNYKF